MVSHGKFQDVSSYEQFVRVYLPQDAASLIVERDPDKHSAGAVDAREALEKSVGRFSQSVRPTTRV